MEKNTGVAVTEVNASALQKVMESESKKRALITKYISEHMKEGTDFGTIRIGGRDSKPSLFKPGSEKFLSLFKLVARFEKDSDTWEMAGSQSGTFSYKCLLYASNGNVVGEGRGVSKLSEKNNWTINNAVKIAEKRAQIDAVLRTGALSDFFTQDLEDIAQETPKMAPYEVKRVVPASDDESTGSVIREGQIMTNAEIHEVQKERIKQLLSAFGHDDLTKQQARELVKNITELDLAIDDWATIVKRLESKLDETDPLAEAIK